MRDIIFHTQWCAALSMVAVQWPDFACGFRSLLTVHFMVNDHTFKDPLLTQTAWATLSYSKPLARTTSSTLPLIPYRYHHYTRF